MSVEANYVYTAGHLEETVHNANLTYNPATGANYSFNDISRRPFPDWGIVLLEYLEGYSNYHGTDLTFTKRFSNRWQATATYTLGFFKDGLPVRPQWYLDSDGIMARRDVGFPLAPDMGGDYGYAGSSIAGGFGQAGDQRHRAVLNGLWDVGYGVQLSGIYFFGSGERFATNTGVDLRTQGNNAASELRLRADGSIAPRAAIVGEADSSFRHAAPETVVARSSRDPGRVVRGVQRCSTTRTTARTRRSKALGAVRKALTKHQRSLPAADAAAGIPRRLLAPRRVSRDAGSETDPAHALRDRHAPAASGGARSYPSL